MPPLPPLIFEETASFCRPPLLLHRPAARGPTYPTLQPLRCWTHVAAVLVPLCNHRPWVRRSQPAGAEPSAVQLYMGRLVMACGCLLGGRAGARDRESRLAGWHAPLTPGSATCCPQGRACALPALPPWRCAHTRPAPLAAWHAPPVPSAPRAGTALPRGVAAVQPLDGVVGLPRPPLTAASRQTLVGGGGVTGARVVSGTKRATTKVSNNQSSSPASVRCLATWRRGMTWHCPAHPCVTHRFSAAAAGW